jgi:3-oxoacyl-[acyl-carrier-protein] synthase-3
MKANIDNIRIKGICGVIPENISYYDDEVANYSHSRESSLKLKKVMGYNQHHVVVGDAVITDLVIPAFKSLVAQEKVIPDEIEALVLVTQTPNYDIPSTSSILHGELGLNESCYCIDINDGCAGFLKGLFECSSLVRNTDINKVLLVTGDVLSRKVSIRDRNSYPLVGDAITLTVVERASEVVNQPLELNYNGKGAFALNIPAGGLSMLPSESTRIPVEDEEGNFRSPEDLVMKGRDVFTFTQTVVIDFISSFVKEHGVRSLDRYFLHQANMFILERIRNKLKLTSEKLPSDVITKYGNSSAATVPMTIVEQYRTQDISNISEYVLLAGFGVGLSWGAALLQINSMSFCDLIKIEV